MQRSAEKTDPELWDRIKSKVQRGSKGGRPGQWSARKAQLAVQEYKASNGGYKGRKSADNHLLQWTREDWGTNSGKNSTQTGERYLPRRAREKLSPAEYGRTTEQKRADTGRGKQFSAQPKPIAAKTAQARLEALPIAQLRRRAAARRIQGRSAMNKADLIRALTGQ